MNATIEDLRPTIIPKSDQLNADELVTGEMDITVTDVRIGSADQPVIIHYQGDSGRPYKPCKTMRRVLILAWGENGRNWIGKSMRLYHAPEVKFGGAAVGGIRISHLTDIRGEIKVSLSETKGKKAPHLIKPMQAPTGPSDVGVRLINAATDVEGLKKVFAEAYAAAKGVNGLRSTLKAAYDSRLAELQAKDGGAVKTFEQWCDEIEAASDKEAAKALFDAALSALPDEHHEGLAQTFDRAWT